ncbi:MAG TPA: nucleotidyltransferase family protein [Planctomycetota bacterium]|nr:nucleotidyltransferase family protein [Planctomycetota bacterium]
MPAIPAVVLAAGGSSRMGAPKGLTPIRGMPAVARVAIAARQGGCDPVIVVTGSNAPIVAERARPAGAKVVENPSWARGRSTSLKAALPHLPSGAAALLVFPVDHPLVGAPVVRALLAAFAGRPDAEVVVPVHGGKRGHPALFAAKVFAEIAALGDDEPLRAVLHRAGRVVLEVPVEDDSVLRNLDRPEDLAAGP